MINLLKLSQTNADICMNGIDLDRITQAIMVRLDEDLKDRKRSNHDVRRHAIWDFVRDNIKTIVMWRALKGQLKPPTELDTAITQGGCMLRNLDLDDADTFQPFNVQNFKNIYGAYLVWDRHFDSRINQTGAWVRSGKATNLSQRLRQHLNAFKSVRQDSGRFYIAYSEQCTD